MSETRVVGIETSSRQGSVALRVGGRVFTAPLLSSQAHARDLLPVLDGLRKDAGLDPDGPFRCDAVCVGIGPGSYTGLRVGIATALGLVRGSGAELRGVPSGEALVWKELRPGEEAAILLDARSREFYYARYRREEEEVRQLTSPTVLTAEEVRARLGDERMIFSDESTPGAAELGEEVSDRLRLGVVAGAEGVIELGAARLASLGSQSAGEVEPLYLRPFVVRTKRKGT